jgi:hypothetical protein
MHRSHSKLQRYAQYVGSVPLMPQSEKHSGFRPVHVAAALTACEARFLAASAGNTNHALSIPVMARVTIRMIPPNFGAIPPNIPGEPMHPQGHPWSDGCFAATHVCGGRLPFQADAELGSELVCMTTWVQWLPFGIVGLQRCLDVLAIPQCLDQRLGVAACLGHAEAPYPGAHSLPHHMATRSPPLKTAKGWRADRETPAWPRTKRNSS